MTEAILIFIIGSVFGSFLNVCIYRLPLKQSVVKPGSQCPSCKKPIAFWQNIPILSYLILGGKCYSCKQQISIQYVVVEIMAGFFTLLTFHYFGFTSLFFIYTVFIYFLIVIGFIDYKTHLIFNKVLLALFIFGVSAQLLFPFIAWKDAVLGLVLGGISMFLIAVLGKAVFKKESMGMGDVKMAMVAGFFVGWQNILIALYVGFVLAFLTMIIISAIKKSKIQGYIPLGPFLAAGLVVFLFWGKQIIHMYLKLVTG